MNTLEICLHWKQFARNKTELRQLLLVQHRKSFSRLLQLYRDYKRRQFNKYILANASILVFKSLQINLQRIHQLKYFLRNVKKFYVARHNKMGGRHSVIQAIRLPNRQKQQYYRNYIPYLCQSQGNSVIVYNFKQQLNQKNIKESINYPFLYYFNKLVTVKRSQTIFKLSELERQRYKFCLARINRFQQQEYQSLECFDYNDTTLRMLLQLFHQKSDIQIYFDFQLAEVAAACKIQKHFRGRMAVHKYGQSFTQIMRLINQSRAIYVIQRWVRRLRQQHRNILFKDISYKASQIETTHLYINLDVYAQLSEVIKSLEFKLKFLEQYTVIVSNAHLARLEIRIPDQEYFGISSYLQQLQQFKYMDIPVFPKWLIKQIEQVPLEDNINVTEQVIKQQSISYQQKNRSILRRVQQPLQNIDENKQYDNVFALLHKGATIAFENHHSTQYIKFSYCCVSEARYRMMALALITYRFNCTYISMISDSILNNMNNRSKLELSQYYQKVAKTYKILINTTNIQPLCQHIQPIILSSEFIDEFKGIQLNFYNDNGKITKLCYWKNNINTVINKQDSICNTSIMEFESGSQSTQIPVRYSIISITSDKLTGPTKVLNPLTNRFKTSQASRSQEPTNRHITSSVTKQQPVIQSIAKSRIVYMYKELDSERTRNRIQSLKKQPDPESSFITEFTNFTSLILRQERMMKSRNRSKQSKQQQFSPPPCNSRQVQLYQQTEQIKQDKQIKQDQIQVAKLPKLQLELGRPKNKMVRLSDIHRYAIFPEELYAIGK